MKYLLALDSFKGSLSSRLAGEAACLGILDIVPDADVKVLAVSDGGDGMLDAYVSALDGQLVTVATRDAMMRPVTASYGVVGTTAVIEVARSIGLSMLTPEERNPLVATSYGVGLMVADAVRRGYKRFVVGLGGTATSDAGIGMLRALMDVLGRSCGAKTFDDLRLHLLKGCEFLLASDVQNPLLGASGAAHVFAPQKGATPPMVEQIERRLKKFAETAAAHMGYDRSEQPGAGAAGGLGYAFMQFLDARVVSGADLLLDRIHFDTLVSSCDVVVTGEGHSDRQTLMGKLPMIVLQRCQAAGKPVVLLSGGVSDAPMLHRAGFSEVLSAADERKSLSENMRVEVAKENICRTIKGSRLVCQ